jgi:tRNA G18 (ribose-2'-O)-methylase SpoU
VIGHERHGVRAWLPARDGAIRIPQTGVESLNAGVAGSIVLYQLMLAPRGAGGGS